MIRCSARPQMRSAPHMVLAAAIALSQGGCARDAADEVEEREGARPAQASPSAAPAQQSTGTVETAPTGSGYSFSEDWFTDNIPVWQEVLGPLKGRPGLHYLEIGLFEGRSALWMLENVLTHPSARLTGIDLFPSDLSLQTYLSNLERSGQAAKATTLRGYSQMELRTLPPESFDIIYVDGSHTADDVLADAVLSWPLLKDGGLLIFDDYDWSGYARAMPERRPFPPDLLPKLAIDAFLTAYRRSLQVVHRDYQLIVQKHPSTCAANTRYQCASLGEYNYLWRARALYPRDTRERVPLTEPELDLIERTLSSIRTGQTEPLPPPELRDDPAFQQLVERLRLTFPPADSVP